MKQNNNNYNIVLDRKTRTDVSIDPMCRLIYGDILSLSQKYGECFAANSYFMNEYHVSRRSIINYLTKLEKQGYILRSTRVTENGIKQRYIKPLRPCEGLPSHVKPPAQGESTPLRQGSARTCTHNIGKNNVDNNISLPIKENGIAYLDETVDLGGGSNDGRS